MRQQYVRLVWLMAATLLLVPACGGTSSPSTSGGAGAGIPDGGGASGPGGGGTADGGAGNSNGGGGGGGTSGTPAAGQGPSACDGLLPSFGDANDLPLTMPSHLTCSFGTTSASGQVAIGLYGAHPDEGWSVDLYTSSGQFIASIAGVLEGQVVSPGTPRAADVQDIDPWFHSTNGGSQGIVHESATFPSLFLRTWDSHGATVSDGSLVAYTSAPDGHGGSVIAATTSDAPGLMPAPLLAWVDAAGRVVRSVPLDRLARVVLVNWTTGHVVVTTRGDGATARWFDADGSALTPWFPLSVPVSATSLHLLVDGTVVVNDGGTWDVALADGVAGTVPVPAWLTARPATRLATIRQGRGYAVLPFTRDMNPSDPLTLEIVDAAGESCGTIAVPLPPATPARTKSPVRLDVGGDGTLFQLSRVDGRNGFPDCEFQWWLGLLH